MTEAIDQFKQGINEHVKKMLEIISEISNPEQKKILKELTGQIFCIVLGLLEKDRELFKSIQNIISQEKK